MLETFEKILAIINQYGIAALLIISIIILIRIISSTSSNWPLREKYYLELLLNLGIWKNSLSDRLDYYSQPGSEYNDGYTNSPRYIFLSESATSALKVIRNQIHVGRIFLSKKSIAAVDKLIAEHWYINEHRAICNEDYLMLTLEEVEKSYIAILSDAQKDLKRNRYLELLKNVALK